MTENPDITPPKPWYQKSPEQYESQKTGLKKTMKSLIDREHKQLQHLQKIRRNIFQRRGARRTTRVQASYQAKTMSLVKALRSYKQQVSYRLLLNRLMQDLVKSRPAEASTPADECRPPDSTS